MSNKKFALEATTNREVGASLGRQHKTAPDSGSNSLQEEANGDTRASATVLAEDTHVSGRHPQSTILPVLFYTGSEAAAILKVNEKTVRRLIDRGLLKKSKAIRHIRITRQSLDEFLAHN